MLPCVPKIKDMEPPKFTPDMVEALLRQATLRIETKLSEGITFDDHAEMAEQHYERAQMYVLKKQYKEAIEDYETCMDYDPYFYEADMGREYVYMTLKELEIAQN